MKLENPLIDLCRKLKQEEEIFLVGGAVRDLLLNKPIVDYDFLLEGDVFTFAKKLGRSLKIKPVINENLLTSSLKTKWGEVNLSRARQEIYPFFGALPQVVPASWREDLKRRDFTINTLLWPLTKDGWGALIDKLGGRRDIKDKIIRVLHPASFQDDPTRILRAIRLKNRLGFTIAEENLKLLKRDWQVLDSISAARRLKEWKLLTTEPDFFRSLQDIYHLGGWPFFFGALTYNEKLMQKIQELAKYPLPEQLKEGLWFIALAVLLLQEPEKLIPLSEYWGLSVKDVQALEKTLIYAKSLQGISSISKRLAHLIDQELPREGLIFLYWSNRQWGTWDEFCQLIRESEMPLKGRDLLKLGIQPGVFLGRILAHLHDSYLDGRFQTRKEGLELAKSYLEEEKDD